MNAKYEYDYMLIRDNLILVKLPISNMNLSEECMVEFFDVRTGVQLKEIYPEFHYSEIKRGYPLSEESARVIMRWGAPVQIDLETNPSKVVTIVEARQRKLDCVVADSILDQLQVISTIVNDFLMLAKNSHREERFWLSQQALTLVRKFSGRELSELEEIVEWFKERPPKK
jgi:hypothetical protein